jgi:hypothetical protein
VPPGSYRIRDVNRAVTSKLGLSLRSGRELVGWYELDGKKRFRIVLQHEHSGPYATGTLHQIRKSLHLTIDQFDLLVTCPMTGRDFENYIRAKVERGEL